MTTSQNYSFLPIIYFWLYLFTFSFSFIFIFLCFLLPFFVLFYLFYIFNKSEMFSSPGSSIFWTNTLEVSEKDAIQSVYQSRSEIVCKKVSI